MTSAMIAIKAIDAIIAANHHAMNVIAIKKKITVVINATIVINVNSG